MIGQGSHEAIMALDYSSAFCRYERHYLAEETLATAYNTGLMGSSVSLPYRVSHGVDALLAHSIYSRPMNFKTRDTSQRHLCHSFK